MRFLVPGRSMIIRNLGEELIKDSSFYSLHALDLDLLGMIEYELDTLPFNGLSKYDRSIRKKIKLLR